MDLMKKKRELEKELFKDVKKLKKLQQISVLVNDESLKTFWEKYDRAIVDNLVNFFEKYLEEKELIKDFKEWKKRNLEDKNDK